MAILDKPTKTTRIAQAIARSDAKRINADARSTLAAKAVATATAATATEEQGDGQMRNTLRTWVTQTAGLLRRHHRRYTRRGEAAMRASMGDADHDEFVVWFNAARTLVLSVKADARVPAAMA